MLVVNQAETERARILKKIRKIEEDWENDLKLGHRCNGYSELLDYYQKKLDRIDATNVNYHNPHIRQYPPDINKVTC